MSKNKFFWKFMEPGYWTYNLYQDGLGWLGSATREADGQWTAYSEYRDKKLITARSKHKTLTNAKRAVERQIRKQKRPRTTYLDEVYKHSTS